MSLPVVFFHNGKHKYLSIAIKRAVSSGNTVYLLGNQDNKEFCENWVDFCSLDSKVIESFKQAYVHMSSQPVKFELFCILRYFYLYEFMVSRGIDRVLLVDSDCLVYKQYADNEYEGYDAAFGIIPGYVCPSSCCWTIKALKNFTEYIFELYTERLSVLEAKWAAYDKTKNGGICDMTLLGMWVHSELPLKILNLAENQETIFECVPVTTTQNEHMYQYNKFTGLLKIRFIEGHPYFLRVDGTLQKVENLHMHGGKKVYMSLFSRYKTNGIAFYFWECYRRFKWFVVKTYWHQK